MAKFRVEPGKRYRATIQLGFFESLASNEMIAGRFEEVGFKDVEVYGEGETRTAEGTWGKAKPASAEMPEQVVEVEAV